MFEELEAQSPLEPNTRVGLVRAHTFFAALRLGLGNREEHEEHLRRAVRIAEDLVKALADLLLASAGEAERDEERDDAREDHR